MKYSIGNPLFFWPKDTIEDFYEKAVATDADIIYLGESVCSKRRELSFNDWFDLAQQVAKSGKQVVLSSLALLEAKSELSVLKKVCNNGEFIIEANDFGAVNLANENNVNFVAGAALNIYNQYDLQYLLKKGMSRWVMPVELSRDWLVNIKQGCQDLNIDNQFEIEVYGYGYLPLAYSARCFTARSEDKPKDQCGLCCINYPKGRLIKSQEKQSLFIMNGIQTMSGQAQNLINDVPQMHDLVDVVRISPDSVEALSWLRLFKQNEQGQAPISLDGFVNGYWHKIEGMNIAG